MKSRTKELLKEAIDEVGDECIFPPDQCLVLQRMVKKIEEAIENESKKEAKHD